MSIYNHMGFGQKVLRLTCISDKSLCREVTGVGMSLNFLEVWRSSNHSVCPT